MPKTITDIIPPSRRRAMEDQLPSGPASMDMGAPQTPASPPPPRPRMTPRSRGRFPWGLAIAALVVVVVCLGLLYAFSDAKVTITPSAVEATVSGEFSATPSTGELPFEIISVDKIGVQSVPAEGTEQANDPAQGSVTIYNEQAKTQELIKNTRFETADGLIFRIHDSIVVPAGSSEKPGVLEATVYADAGGVQYNIGPSTFTLPGLNGSPVFNQVYAKSASSMEGGFTGTRPSVSDATKDAQSGKIEQGLASELAAAIEEKVPEGYVLVPGGVTYSYVRLPAAQGKDAKTVNVQEKGTATAVVFPNTALAKAVAYQINATYTGEPVMLESAEKLTLTPKAGSVIVAGAPSFSFSLAGPVRVIWTIDKEKIAGTVAGKSREAAGTLLHGLPEIEKAVLSLKPFWAAAFPATPADIQVIVEEPHT